MELSQIKGVGPSRLKAFHAAGISSLRDLLYAVPVKYRNVGQIVEIADAQVGTRCTLQVLREGEAKLIRHGRKCQVTCTFTDDSGAITACWFNQPWMKETLNRQTRFTFHGLVDVFGRRKRLMNPSIETELRLVPSYKPIEGVPQKTHEAIVRQALEEVHSLCPETLPQEILDKHGLVGCAWAIRALHAPSSMEEIVQAQKRFAFEQMLLYQAAVRMVRDFRRAGLPMKTTKEQQQAFWQSLPFAPTGAQKRTLEEIAPDISFMVLQRDKDEWSDHLQGRKLNYVGVEALFAREDSEFAAKEYVEQMNAKGLIVWVNSIVYNYREVLTAGHNDDISVTGHPDEGWGWLIERGYNLIQTDWPLALKCYIEGIM